MGVGRGPLGTRKSFVGGRGPLGTRENPAVPRSPKFCYICCGRGPLGTRKKYFVVAEQL